MPLFLIYCFFVDDTGRIRRNTLLLLGCSRLEGTGRRIAAGWQVECCEFIWVLRSKSVEELPSVPNGTRTSNIRG
jgi:hypothetical protein